MTSYPVLIASSDIEIRNAIRAILAEDGLSTICASTVKETQEALANTSVSIVICDGNCPMAASKTYYTFYTLQKRKDRKCLSS
jgi:DNA-binding NtrC family response regulator